MEPLQDAEKSQDVTSPQNDQQDKETVVDYIVLRGVRYYCAELVDTMFLPFGVFFEGIDRDQAFQSSGELAPKNAALLIRRLANGSVIANLAYALTSIFPTLPPDLVHYSLDAEGRVDFRMRLTIQEIMEALNVVGKLYAARYAEPEAAPPTKPTPVGFTSTVPPQNAPKTNSPQRASTSSRRKKSAS